jgi:hypothetical protein
MKIPTHCPKCGDVLLNEEVPAISSSGVWRKMCSKRLNHKFAVFYNINESEVSSLCIQITNKVEALWDFRNKLISISKKKKTIKELLGSTQFIPYFEPDLSDYKKLVSKMKTYILFL